MMNDPCCGSGVYGQEANPDTWKMAKINMAIRGIDADFGPHQADPLTNDLHPTLRADFILLAELPL